MRIPLPAECIYSSSIPVESSIAAVDPVIRLHSVNLVPMSIIRQLLLPALSTFLLLSCFADIAYAQPTAGDGPRYPGSTGQYMSYDTMMHKELQRRSAESAGLLEDAIDPKQYVLGPNDEVTLTIWTGNSIQQTLLVTPEAKLIVERVGEIDVRNKTLAEAKGLVRDAVTKVYRVSDISLSLSHMRTFKVNVLGAVSYPGPVAATPASRVSEVIELAGGATALASKRKVYMTRNGTRRIVDLLPYYSEGLLDANPFVQGGDVVWVGVQDGKDVIVIQGAVARPGEFPFNAGDSISSLIRYAFGFTADAFTDSIEVVSTDTNGEIGKRDYVRALPDGSIVGNRPLRAGDRVYVRARPNFLETHRVVVTGQMKRPGSYAIESRKTTLREIIERAGGFTDNAAITDARLTRRVEIERDPYLVQISQIDPEKRTPAEVEYFRTKILERPGVMTVDFSKLMAGDESENITLVGEDSLWVPSQKDYITLSGRVKNPGNVIFKSGMTYENYVELAGGFGWRADDDETRIIKGRSGDTFLASSDDYVLEPGDQIFVPEEPQGDFWEGFTQVVTVAAQLLTIVAVVISISSSTK
jgi:protein involved in polysaccharide export with SLBB domain